VEQKKTSAQERWTRIISEQHASGLKVRSYCEQSSINTKTFYNWSKRLSVKNAAPSSFIKLTPPVIVKVNELHIETPNGYRLDVMHAGNLRSVLEMFRAL
jgi:hypothetical protein